MAPSLKALPKRAARCEQGRLINLWPSFRQPYAALTLRAIEGGKMISRSFYFPLRNRYIRKFRRVNSRPEKAVACTKEIPQELSGNSCQVHLLAQTTAFSGCEFTRQNSSKRGDGSELFRAVKQERIGGLL